MIKPNDICIQYTAWCRRDTHGDQFNTHAMVNETGARPLATQWKSDETTDSRDRPAERDRRVGREILSVLVKIKTIQRSMRVLPMRGSSNPLESTRRDDKIVRPCVIQGRKWRENKGINTELGPRIRDNPCILHTVEINILIFSLGRYAHRAVLTRIEKPKKKKTNENEQAVAQTVSSAILRRRLRRDVRRSPGVLLAGTPTEA